MALPMRKPQPGSRSPVVLPMPRSRWLHVVSHLDPKYGGLSAAVPALGEALAESHRCRIEIAAFCTPGEEFEPAAFDRTRLSFWPASRGTWLHNQKLKASFAQQIERVDGLHLHGLWELSTALSGSLARQAHKPYVVSAHGMLEPWALRNKRLKKIFYAALIERRTIARASCLHALTRAEADDYRRFGARGPIAIIPNGVRLPAHRDPAPFFARHPHLRAKRIVLFLGRLQEKKGVDLLVRAWAEIASRWPEAHLVLAGPDFEGTRGALERMVAAAHIESQVTFTGMLRDEMKWSALTAAEGFVLPSHSEGLSVSILEAMGMGLPVIVTAQCHMPEVVENQAGWQIQPVTSQLATALGELLRNSPLLNAEIGCRGSYLVERQYKWSSIAARMADVYRWVQGGPYPNDVELMVGYP